MTKLTVPSPTAGIRTRDEHATELLAATDSQLDAIDRALSQTNPTGDRP